MFRSPKEAKGLLKEAIRHAELRQPEVTQILANSHFYPVNKDWST